MIINGTYPERSIKGLRLLWKNDDLNTSFEPQTIELELSKYEQVYVTCCYVLGGTQYYPVVVQSSITDADTKVCFYRANSNDKYQRAFTITDSGIVFGPGQHGSETDDTQMIPYCVYGNLYASKVVEHG